MSSPNVVSGTLNHNVNEANLIPILPANIRETRYQNDIRVKMSSTTIPLGANFGSAPSYQSQGWTISVHPEGKRYAYNQAQEGITFVTEAHVLEPGVSDQLDGWLALIRGLAADSHVHLPGTSDLFIEIDQKLGNCYYYFADHGHRTVFWLHAVDTTTVGLPDSCSKGHLQYALEENYWSHVEMFPDTASRYSITALSELENLLLHARADALTSDVPTFPYTGEENERFIDILQRGKEHAPNAYVTTYVARLWVVVANHRFFTHFGEDHCRMSSCQSVLDVPKRKQNLILTTISKALFGLPNGHRTRLEGLWVDELAYTSAWHKYVFETVEDLKQRVIWNFALLIANLLMIPISYSPALTKSSMLLCILGLGITFVLFQEQRKLVDTDSSTAAGYLDARNTSYGFQPTAIVHSLPHASFIWALLLFAIQGFWMTFSGLPTEIFLPVVIPVAVVLVVACMGIWIALHPREKAFEDATVLASVPTPDSSSEKDQTTVEAIV